MIILKTEEEINGIRKSCKLLAKLFVELKEFIKVDVTLLEIDKFVYDFITKNGGRPAFLNYMGFPASACISVNDTVIHGIPDNTRVKDGDLVSVDIGINLNGYISDAARTFPVGNISSEARKLIDVTKRCLELGIEQAIAGNRVRDISKAVYNHASKNNFGVVYQYCGHGVGIKVHESPEVPNVVYSGKNPRLKPGMVLAIEPMINLGTDEVEVLDDGWTVKTLDRKLSCHFENDIAIFDDHTEILSVL